MVFLLNERKNDRLDILVRKTRKGNQRAAEELYKELLPFVKGIIHKNIYRIAAEEVDVLSHDIVTKIFEKLDRFDPKRNGVFPWAGRIAKNHIIDQYRRDKKESSLDRNREAFYALPSEEKTPELLTIQKENRERLQRILRGLSHEKLRLIMEYADGASMKELAERHGRSVGAITTEVFRIKKHIKSQYFIGEKVDNP